jgi:hypothetical protein
MPAPEPAPEPAKPPPLALHEPGTPYELPPDFDPAHPVRLSEVWVGHPNIGQQPHVETGDPITVHVRFDAHAPTPGVVFVMEIRLMGDLLMRTDTDVMGCPYDLPAGPGLVEFRFVSFPFLDGSYDVTIGVQSRRGGEQYDWSEPATSFEVVQPGRTTGLVALPMHVALVAAGGVDLSEALITHT